MKKFSPFKFSFIIEVRNVHSIIYVYGIQLVLNSKLLL